MLQMTKILYRIPIKIVWLKSFFAASMHSIVCRQTLKSNWIVTSYQQSTSIAEHSTQQSIWCSSYKWWIATKRIATNATHFYFVHTVLIIAWVKFICGTHVEWNYPSTTCCLTISTVQSFCHSVSFLQLRSLPLEKTRISDDMRDSFWQCTFQSQHYISLAHLWCCRRWCWTALYLSHKGFF